MKPFDYPFSIYTEGEFVAETPDEISSDSSQKRNLEINIGTADISMSDVLHLRPCRVRLIDHGNQPDRSPSQNIDS